MHSLLKIALKIIYSNLHATYILIQNVQIDEQNLVAKYSINILLFFNYISHKGTER